MFISHSFPYLSKGPFLCTGSGGYGYMENQENDGAGGGIIFILVNRNIHSNYTKLLVDGGSSGGNNFVSAGSGGTLFMYSEGLIGTHCNFSSSGGPSYNVNGSGGGGIIKISYDHYKFYYPNSMWVNVTPGYQPPDVDYEFSANGLFYGTFCTAGYYQLYLACH